MFDPDLWAERAAIMEYEGGLSRFAAETGAAVAMGVNRWEALHAERERNLAAARDRDAAGVRDAAGAMPRVQPAQAQQDGSVPVGDVQAGWDRVALPSLPVERGGVL